MIAIADYGMGNIGSILNMLKKVAKTDVFIADKPELLFEADKIILPGVGAFDMGVKMLKEKGFWNTLKENVEIQNKPILGICLGMQLLGYGSEEGKESGLGFIPFACQKFCCADSKLRVPHMGWNYVSVQQENCSISEMISSNPRYYFVHSYYAICENKNDVLMTCNYGIDFVAAVHRNNVYGTQFHPEKSHKYGMEIISNFARKC